MHIGQCSSMVHLCLLSHFLSRSKYLGYLWWPLANSSQRILSVFSVHLFLCLCHMWPLTLLSLAHKNWLHVSPLCSEQQNYKKFPEYLFQQEPACKHTYRWRETLTRLSSMVSCFLGHVSKKHTWVKYISEWISEFLWQTCLMMCFMLYKWRMPSLNMTRRHPFESIAFDIPWPKT